MLFDALDHFERKNPKADENIRSIKAELSDAVDCCIEAAGFEFQHYYQRALLKVIFATFRLACIVIIDVFDELGCFFR